jgi:phospholipid transport system transporter-binding protein
VSKLHIRDQGAGHFVVEGNLTFSTIDKNTVKSLDFLTAAKQVTVDLSGITLIDSAGLALMIEWIKYTRSKRIHLSFKNLPEQLLNLAKLSGFDEISHFTIQAG